MKRSTILLFLFVFVGLQQGWGYVKDSIFVNVNGQRRNMIVFTPNELPAKSPLFIITHGMNQNPEYQYGSDKIYEMADTAKFVAAYLRSDGNTWDVGGTKDQTFVTKTIDEMVSRHDIDRDRVYWSGFSMGSMLIHHCIANMQDKIAAFAPTSGIQFSEQPWNNCKKPVNLLECIAYGDDVFGYEQYGIHAYIENYAKHDQHTKYSKTIGYRPVGSSWQNGDMEQWTGGPNGGEVWLYSYNNGGHWPTDQNRHLIWNFCKRFALNQPKARITMPEGETTFLNMTPDKNPVFPDIDIEATATATKGEVAKVEIYDGTTLIATLTEAPYQATLKAPKAGTHQLRVVVTDSDGKTGENTCQVNCVATAEKYNMCQTFVYEGAIPQNWCVTNGNTTRVGGGMPYSTGNRLLRFTNESRGFEYGLMVQNTSGQEKAAWARFGDKKGRSHMTLHAGNYSLLSRVVNWNQADHTPVIYAIEDMNGEVVATKTFTPTGNVGGNTANKFKTGRGQTFTFDIAQTGDYVLSFYADATKNADFVLGMATLEANSFNETGIEELRSDERPQDKQGCFDLSGRRLDANDLKPGLYIIDGRKVVKR